MRGTAVYVNVMPKECKRLVREGRFMFETTGPRLCRSDWIRVLTDSGVGMATGRSCRLGNFYAITREDAEKLKQPPELEPEPIPPAEPEDPQVSGKSAKDEEQD
jgi:hypothetical protein